MWVQVWLGLVQDKLLYRTPDMPPGSFGVLLCSDLSDAGPIQQKPASEEELSEGEGQLPALISTPDSILCANGQHLLVVQHVASGTMLWLLEPFAGFSVHRKVRLIPSPTP